jgi:multicomponent Na+:H+ antiporter subunit E
MKWIARLWHIANFLVYYVVELFIANLRVMYDVLTPRHHSQPGFIIVPTKAKTDLELMALANLLTMTPGTLALDVAPNRDALYIHVMFLDDAEATRTQIIESFEPRVLRMFR